MTSVSELKLDLEELESLSKTSKRLRVQDYLAKEISRLTKEIEKLATKSTATPSDKKDKPQVYNENIKNYAWDQSDKFTKIYLTLDHDLKDEDVEAAFTEKSVKVTLRFQHKHCHLNIAKLYEDVKPTESYAKVKPGLVTVFLKKKSPSKTWTYLTDKEKDKDQFSKPNVDPEEDPGASLQKMLKQMYEGGDDEMKRTIAKAFHESQAKKEGGGGGDPMAGLGSSFAGL